MSLELVVAEKFVVVALGWDRIGLDGVDCCDEMPEYLVATGRRYWMQADAADGGEG